MSVILYHGSGAGDFSLDVLAAANCLNHYRRNVSDLLSARGHTRALELFQRFPWQLREASNLFGDDFSVLHATVPLKLYEYARQLASAMTPERERFCGNKPFGLIAPPTVIAIAPDGTLLTPMPQVTMEDAGGKTTTYPPEMKVGDSRALICNQQK